MINLLPEEDKKELRAARANVVLLRYNVIAAIALGFLITSCMIVFLLVTESKRVAEAANAENTAKASGYSSTKTEADTYHKNLAISKQILNNEVNYTKVVFAITELLPTNVVLDSVNLNAKDFGSQITFSAHSKTLEDATRLKQNFQNSKLFSNVYFQTINNDSKTNDSYPYGINISVKINKVTQ